MINLTSNLASPAAALKLATASVDAHLGAFDSICSGKSRYLEAR